MNENISALVVRVTSETLLGVQLEYRSELLKLTQEWALLNAYKWHGTSGFKYDRFTDEVIDKMQDIAASNGYPLVSDLFPLCG